MGLTDVHGILGVLLGRAFHSWQPRAPAVPVIPSSFPPSLRALLQHPRFAKNASAPLERWLLAGGLLAQLPDIDVFVAAALQSWSRGHRGPTHSGLFCGAASALLTLPLASWLRTSKTRAFLFALLCIGSHTALDAVGNAGVPLWWPHSKKAALGIVTVWDVPMAAAFYAAFSLSSVSFSSFSVSPLLLLSALVAALFFYLRWKRHHYRLACGYFHARHLYAPGPEWWIHPWALFPRTFSLARHDGQILDTVCTRDLDPSQVESLAYPNVADAKAVRLMYFNPKNSRSVFLDLAAAAAFMASFWGGFAYYHFWFSKRNQRV